MRLKELALLAYRGRAAGACVMSGLMTAPDPARLVGQLRKEAGE